MRISFSSRNSTRLPSSTGSVRQALYSGDWCPVCIVIATIDFNILWTVVRTAVTLLTCNLEIIQAYCIAKIYLQIVVSRRKRTPVRVQIRVCILIKQSRNTTSTIIAAGVWVATPDIVVITLCCIERNLSCLACWVDSCNLGNQGLGKVNQLTKSADFVGFLLIGNLVQLCTTCCVKSTILNIVVLTTISYLNLEQVCTALKWVGGSTLAHLKVSDVHTLGDCVRYNAEVGHILCNLKACRCRACNSCACCSSRCCSKRSCSYYKLGI